MASKTISTILNLKDNFSKTITKTTQNTKQFQRQVQHTQNQVKRMKQAVNGAFGSMAAKAGGLIAGIGIATFAKDSLMLASNLNEVQNVVDTTFGKSSKAINDFASNAGKQFGISELQAKQFSGTLGAMMKSSGISGDKLTDMSKGLTGLAGDMASFYNLDPAESFEKIKSAMVGSTEPMLALGINMSVASMEAYAMQKGIKKAWKEMTEAEKQTLRYTYLLEKSKDAQGDYEKTNKAFANSLRTLTLKIKDLGAKIMVHAIPPLEKLFGTLIKIIDGVKVEPFMNKVIALAKRGFKVLGNTVKWVKDNFNWLLPVLAGVVATMKTLAIIESVRGWLNGMTLATKLMTMAQSSLNLAMLASPWTWVAIAIGTVVTAGVALWKNWDWVCQKAQQLHGWLVKIGLVAESNGKKISLAEGNKIAAEQAKKLGVSIPGYANGTQYFRGGTALVGERGPELVNLPGGSKVTNNTNTKKVLNSSNNNSFNITINTGSMSSNEVINDLMPKLKLALANI